MDPGKIISSQTDLSNLSSELNTKFSTLYFSKEESAILSSLFPKGGEFYQTYLRASNELATFGKIPSIYLDEAEPQLTEFLYNSTIDNVSSLILKNEFTTTLQNYYTKEEVLSISSDIVNRSLSISSIVDKYIGFKNLDNAENAAATGVLISSYYQPISDFEGDEIERTNEINSYFNYEIPANIHVPIMNIGMTSFLDTGDSATAYESEVKSRLSSKQFGFISLNGHLQNTSGGLVVLPVSGKIPSSLLNLSILDSFLLKDTYSSQSGKFIQSGYGTINWNQISTNTIPGVSTFSNDIGYLTSFTESDPIFRANSGQFLLKTGTANIAKKLETPRTIQINGFVRGSGTFDGSSNININVTINDSEFSTKFNALASNFDKIPSGLIAWFNLTKAPKGWIVCDGKSKTITNVNASPRYSTSITPPNLIGRYARGATSSIGELVEQGLPNITRKIY